MFCGTVSSNWASGEDDHVVGRAEYDFNAVSEEEISFRAGEMLKLAPKGKMVLIHCDFPPPDISVQYLGKQKNIYALDLTVC